MREALQTIELTRTQKWHYVNGLVVSTKNSPNHLIKDRIEIFPGSFPKKYTAIISTMSDDTPAQFKYKKKISFGDQRYDHYFDQIGLYSHLNHKDDKRRESFRSRFRNAPDYPSAAWLSKTFLW